MRLRNTGIVYVLYPLENWGVYGNGSFESEVFIDVIYFTQSSIQSGGALSTLALIRESTCRGTGYHVRIFLYIYIFIYLLAIRIYKSMS
jgi:hypothetical protein